MSSSSLPSVASMAPTAAARVHAFEREQLIRFSHCDPAGIVYFPQYLVMTNALVEDWFNQALGLSYAGLISDQRVGLPIVRLEVDFTAPSRLGDTVQLGLSIERLGSRSLTLAFGCRGGEGGAESRFQARQVLVFTSLQTHRAILPPPAVQAALQRFHEQHAFPQET